MSERDMSQYVMIGARIREVRTSKGMSQSDLAEAANISLPHISDIERGKVAMRLSTFIKISEALQVSADTLIRQNIPEVKGIYHNEFSDLLAELSPDEMEAVLRVIKEFKKIALSSKESQ